MVQRHILITGAASGIGRATAVHLAGTGHLCLIDRDADGLAKTAERIGHANCTEIAMDITDLAGWEDLRIAPALTGAVICAGVSDAALIEDMDFSAWRRVLSINLDGAFLSLQAALKCAADGASIVAVSSATGHKAAQMTAAYGASKAGLTQLVKVAALEAAARGVRVNAVAPGGVKTPMFSDQEFFAALKDQHGGEDGAWAALAEATPSKRFAAPEEIAGLIGFLLGEESASMTGAIVSCDGGYGL